MQKRPTFSVTLYNTLGRKQQPLDTAPKIKMYVCGITPYDYAHLGHGRCYVTFDLVYRLATELGYEVTYCRNFTDIDDKLLDRAKRDYNDITQYRVLADQFIGAFKNDMKALNCLLPAYEPRVTDSISDIIKFIEKIIARGHAYAVDGDVYFSIARFPDYGTLSHRSLDDLMPGAR